MDYPLSFNLTTPARPPRMGYTIGIVWCYYTRAWYSIGIVWFWKMTYILYQNYTNILIVGNSKPGNNKIFNSELHYMDYNW